MNIIARTALVVLIAFFRAAIAEPIPGQIVVDQDNKSWLFYTDGAPFFLASPGDPEDFLYRGNRNADGTRDGDQQDIIAKLAPTGANGIYMQIIRSNGGDGGSTHNPFINSDPTQGLSDAILDQWESWFSVMDDNGIVIYLFFYDDGAGIWTGSTVGDEENQFFSAIINRFEHHKHLIWIIAEEYGERYSAQRVSALAAVIRSNDDHDHPIAVHKNGGLTFDEFANDANIDQFAMQYNVTSAPALHSGVVTAWNNAAGRYNVNMSEATQWGTGEIARKKAWAAAMGGSYVMGLGMNIIDTPVNDLRDLGRLRLFMESTDVHSMSPRDDLATADTTWVLADPGRSYIAYAADGVSQLGLTNMQSGTYQLAWFDPVTGNSVFQEDVTVTAGRNAWSKPASFGSEVALYMTTDQRDTTTRPSPPSNLTAE